MHALDSLFWYVDDKSAPLHIASVAVFDGPAPTPADLRRRYRRVLPLVPRLRQRVQEVPLGLTRPGWTDDTSFTVAAHVSSATAAAPGGTAELTALVADLLSEPLDLSRPLWHAWLIDGLEDGRWALLSKLHHSMVDGLAGIDVLAHVLDPDPNEPARVPDRWVPRPRPGLRTVASAVVRDDFRAVREALRTVRAQAVHPVTTTRNLAGASLGLGRYARSLLPTADVHLTGPIGPERSYRVADACLADIKAVRAVLGGSVNDVVLAMATSAVRDLIVGRDEVPSANSVRCLVPVSVRDEDAAHRSDNRVSALLADLPVEFADPLTRYRALMVRTRGLKSSHEAQAGTLLTTMADYIPPPLFATAMRVAFRLPQRSLTTVVTNVPGPMRTRTLLGRRMVEHYPYVPIADRVRLGIAVTSYDGRLYFGVTGDRASMPDIDTVSRGLVHGLAELLAAARGAATTPEEALR
jgi:diacylglycerol O-acyltransferase